MPPQRPALSPERASRAEATFNSALERSTAERSAYIAGACGEDEELQARVSELLAAHERAGGFLDDDAPLSPELEEQLARLKPEEAGDRIGPYKLLQEMGQGGFGTVWMADQEKPVRLRVALKILKMGMDTQEVIARFGQERQALAMMDHPNIAKVLDAGATQYGRPFFVMELVRGMKITEYCDEQKLSTQERSGSSSPSARRCRTRIKRGSLWIARRTSWPSGMVAGRSGSMRSWRREPQRVRRRFHHGATCSQSSVKGRWETTTRRPRQASPA